MTRFSITTLLLMGIMMAAPASSGENRTLLISDGEAFGRIFLPEKPGRPLQFAAEELRNRLEEMTGVRLQYAWRGRRSGDTGIALSVRDDAGWKGEASAQAFTIEADGGILHIRGNTETAVAYGVYQYLHELGVRWFAPGANPPITRTVWTGGSTTGSWQGSTNGNPMPASGCTPLT